ncbi:MAG: sigma-70 family RNA polymerase sigma factor [Bacteroidota bacterium]
MDKNTTEKVRLEQIRMGDQRLLQQLYHEYRENFLAWGAQKFSCPREDAVDVYQKAFTIFYFNIKEGKLTELTSSLKTYLFSIGRNVFLKRFRDKHLKVSDLDDTVIKSQVDYSIMDSYNHRDQADLVRRLLNMIGEPCRQLLELLFIKAYSTDAVMHTMELKNEQAVRKRKFLCLKKMRDLIAKSDGN